MKFFLFGREEGLSVTELPAEREGRLSIFHKDKDGIRSRILDLEGNGHEWTVFSTPNGTICMDGMPKREVKVKEETTFVVKTNFGDNYLYFSESHGNTMYYAFPENGKITIGGENCDIGLNATYMGSSRVELTYGNGKAIASDVSFDANNAGVYLNYAFLKTAELVAGDIIDLFGLKIVYLCNRLAVYAYGADIRVSPYLHKVHVDYHDGAEHTYNMHMLPEDEELFTRSPRLAPKHEDNRIVVDAPPPPINKEETPLILSVGSSAFMSISSVMMAVNTATSASANGGSMMSVMPSMLMAGGMLVGSMLMPVITRKYNDKRNAQKESERRSKYLSYLNSIDMKILEAGKKKK